MKLRGRLLGSFGIVFAVVLCAFCFLMLRGSSERLDARAATEFLVINEENQDEYLNIQSNILYGFKQAGDQPVIQKDRRCVVILEIPDSVTEIGESAFAGYTNLYSVTLNSGINQIDTTAFQGCVRLAEVCNQTKFEITAGGIEAGEVALHALNVCSDKAARTLIRNGDFVYCYNANAQTGENEYKLVAYLGNAVTLTLPTDYRGQSYDIFNGAFMGNDSLREVYLPDGLKEIDDLAFSGCKSLISVSLPDTLTEIGNNAFYDCWGLKQLTVPASVERIGSQAFYSCAQLSTVNFEDGDVPLEIGDSAFRECMSLAAVNFPDRLKSLAPRAFLGAGLSSVYLPSGVKYLTGEAGAREYFDRASLMHFIFKTRDAYLAGLENESLAAYVSRMTYLVNISFDFGIEAQSCDSEVRLAGQIYSYTAGDNLVWSGTAQDRFVSLPLQSGYGKSVWFSDSEYGNQVGYVSLGGALVGSDNTGLNTLLAQTEIVDGVSRYTVEDVTLYARYISKPDYSGKSVPYSTSTYALNDGDYLYDLVNGWYDDLANRDLFIASYNGITTGSIGGTAGTYPIEFQIKDGKFGAWATPVVVNAVIDKLSFDIGNYSDWRITWGKGSPVSLIENNKIYIYEKDIGGGKVPFASELTAQEITDGGFRPNPEVRTVYNSVARYRRGEELTLEYVFRNNMALSDRLADWEFIPYDEEGNYQRAAGEAGVYTARLKVTAIDNYRLISDLSSANERGIVINFNADRSVATITKTWYIVEFSNQVIVDKDYGMYEEKIPYFIDGWTYGDAYPTLPNAPTVEFFDRTLGEETPAKLGFTLTGALYSGGDVRFVDVHRENFHRFINATMPAGSYVLTVKVPAVTDDTDVFYPAYEDYFPFTVSPALLDGDMLAEADELLNGKSFDYKRDGNLHFYDPDILLRILDLKSDDLNPPLGEETENVWARSDYRQFYSSAVSVSYNLNRMADANYLTEREFSDGEARFAPRNADVYTVYYQISAKNYAPHVNVSSDSERRNYSFSVTIYEEFSAPSFHADMLVYTGGEVLPDLGESSAYEVLRVDGDDYTSVGSHALILKLYGFVPSKWEGQPLPTGEDDPNSRFLLTFEIKRAKNETIGTLSLIAWTWDSYPEDSVPVFNTRFKDEGDSAFYTFTLTSHSDPNEVYTYGTDNGFDRAPAGSYVFRAYAKGYDENVAGSEKYSWEAYSAQIDEIRISPATNRWLETPNIIRWHWGDYDSAENLISARPAYPEQGACVLFSVLDENRLPVKDADGKEITLLKDFSNDSSQQVSAEVGAALKNLPVGSYYLIAKVAGAGNYTELDTSREGEMPLVFHILQAQNLWEETPNILSWNEGNYDAAVNLVFARAKFGETAITFFRPDGSQIALSELGSLKAGAYKMRAVVEETDNYTGLIAEFDFLVSLEAGPLGSPLGQIIALCVIGVLGVGLAVTLIINIIRIKRETDEEIKNDKY